MKKTVRIIALAICMAITLSSFCLSVGADASKFDAAVAFMNKEEGVFMSVSGIYEDASTTAEYIYQDGNAFRIAESAADSMYFIDVATETPSVIMYAEDIAPQEDGWYSFDINTMEFALMYDLVAEFNFLRESFADSCFDISFSGATTILTAKAEYANAVAHSFFGDFSYEENGIGMYDDYSNVKLYINNGYISKVTADNKYGAIGEEATVIGKYTAEFKFGSFTLPEYKKLETVYEIGECEEFTAGISGTVSDPVEGLVYSFTPEETMTVRFESTSTDGDPVLEIADLYDDSGLYCKVISSLDDKSLTDYNFLGSYTFVAGKTYYLLFNDYEGVSYSFTSEEILFYGDDLTGDGKINAADASAVLRFDVGLEAFSDEQLVAADANQDGKVNAMDASAFLQYNVGLIRK